MSNINETCWPRGPHHDWVDEVEIDGELYWTCDRCGEESSPGWKPDEGESDEV